MARHQQNTVDYFPFLCKEGQAMYYIENKYGNDGYATWIKILRQLAVTNYHYLNLSNYTQLMFLSSKCKITEDKLIEIITDLCNIGEFNKELWAQNRIVFSEKFIENIKDAYSRRKNECINMHTLCIHLNSLSIQSAYILSQIAYTNLQKQDINTHSIVEYSIVKNSKVNDSKEEKFFDENLQLPYIIKDGKNIYGNDDQIRFGGMSEFAIKKHLEDIENVKNKLNGK
jgi:glutaredoxin